jgi:hypothetical protein
VKIEIYVPDQLWHAFKRAFPNANLNALVRSLMHDAIRDTADERREKATPLGRG